MQLYIQSDLAFLKVIMLLRMKIMTVSLPETSVNRFYRRSQLMMHIMFRQIIQNN